MSPPRHWIYYALGGGMGHLTRAISLCRAVTRQNHGGRVQRKTRVSILTNSPFATSIPVESLLADHSIGCHHVQRLAANAPRDETTSAVLTFLAKTPADAFIVDTFPRGLGGELAGFLPMTDSQTVLIHRNLTRDYCEQFGLREFVRHYEKIILPGESAPLENQSHASVTRPWLILNRDELLSTRLARKALAIDSQDEIPTALVIGCGRHSEVQFMSEAADELTRTYAGKLNIRFATTISSCSFRESLSVWPMMKCLPAVSLIIGSGGYNTVNEARATGVPLLAFAQKRMYDQQHDRLTNNECCDSLADVRSRIDDYLRTGFPRSPMQYQNGTDQAVQLIQMDRTIQQQQ